MDKAEVLAWLEKKGTRRTVDGMAALRHRRQACLSVCRWGLCLRCKKRSGGTTTWPSALWDSGVVRGAPACRARRRSGARDAPADECLGGGFENWGDCDTVCFNLFDRTPLRGRRRASGRLPAEFVKRGGFVLMACLALHDKTAPDRRLLAFLPLIEKGAATSATS